MHAARKVTNILITQKAWRQVAANVVELLCSATIYRSRLAALVP